MTVYLICTTKKVDPQQMTLPGVNPWERRKYHITEPGSDQTLCGKKIRQVSKSRIASLQGRENLCQNCRGAFVRAEGVDALG